jgi:glucose/arabinose dehydrogenase
VRRAIVATVAALAALGGAAPAHAVTLPAGFSDELVATVAAPTAVAFTPDGRMLVATQRGQLRVRTAGGTLLATPAFDLSARVCSNSERGLLGVAVDPSFALNHFIYAYYTSNKFNSCVTGSLLSPVNRVARFVLADNNIVDVATETVLVDNLPSWGGNHNGGDLEFGRDGQLYVSVGDGGCDYAGNSGCAAQNDAVRDQHVLLGKILRITPSGGIPVDNPFQGAGTARCNVTGMTAPGNRCQETYAWGLRNPFRIAFDPNAAGTRFYINDVGQNTWEEIDLGAAGADYGWNVREGHCATGSTTNCGAPPAGMTNPVFDYGRSDGCGSITGGAFVPNVIWPTAYRGKYLFSDYVCGRIFRLDPNGAGGFTRVDFATGLGAGSAVHMLFGPAGTSQALYYTTYAGGGAVRRIVFNAGNTSPTAALAASPTAGAPPLLVNFDGSGSRDPDAGDTLTYIWSFGDGTATAETASANTSHVYQSPGAYTASLRVRDSRGATSTAATVRIDVGNTPQQPTINSPAAGQRFGVGEVITLDGSATDPQEGRLPAGRLSWTVERVHGAHTHPYLTVTGSPSSFTGPPPEDLAATTNSYVLVTLTATDSQGLSASISRAVQPKLVDLAFSSKPGGLTLELNGAAFSTPRTWTAWEGWQLSVNAPDQGRYRFISWSDGGARLHMITAPASATTYQATFRRRLR